MRLPSLPRTLLLATVLASGVLAVGGFALGRSLGTETLRTAAPVQTTPPAKQLDPIVIPEPLEIPGA